MGTHFPIIRRKLIDILGLKFPPVAVALIRRVGDIPQGVAELDKPMFYCGMIKYAMLENIAYFGLYVTRRLLMFTLSSWNKLACKGVI